ncbi:MAG: transglutaminase-like domain-containing protein [Acidimicrobiales bacterium]|jgi:hypothetical protein
MTRLSLPRFLVGVLLSAAAAGTFIASMPWLRAYQVSLAPLLLALSAAAPVVISVIVSRALRFAAGVSYAASLTGLVALLAVSNEFDFNSIWNGLVHVPAQLLTETLPLAGGSYLMAAPIVLTWLCAALSAELLLRPVSPSALGPGVPVLFFVIAFAATTSAPAGPTIAEGAGLFGALVVGALARQGVIDAQVAHAEAGREGLSESRSRRRHSSLRRAVSGTAMAAVLVVALAVGVSHVPDLADKPAALTRSTKLLSATVVDPLDALASLRRSDPGGPPHTLFKVQVERPWSGYMSLAVLDNYDGDIWTSSATFRPTGGRVPSSSTASPNEPGSQVVTQRYTLQHGIGLPFLPVLDRPVQVDGLSVDADPITGMLAASPSLPASYSVSSEVPSATARGVGTANLIASGAAVPGGDIAEYTELPPGSVSDVAAAVRFAVGLTGLQARPSLGFLEDVDFSLRDREKRVVLRSTGLSSNPAALAGTSLAQVMNAVTVDHAATPEQFATFFAVVGRYLGVPVRVVTGFRAPSAANTAGPLPPGDYELTNRDAWTWDELPVAGYGWVVVDPTPVLTTADPSAPAEPVKAAPRSQAKQATALPGNGAAHAIAKPVNVKLTLPLHLDWTLVFGAGLPAAIILTLLIGGLGVPALRRRLRRLARHRLDDPALLATGAWLELLDGLSRLGVEVPSSATSTDVTAQVTDLFGEDLGPAVQLVGTLADQALYSTELPVDPEAARLAWESQRRLYRSVRHSLPGRDRAHALLLVGTSPGRPEDGASR